MKQELTQLADAPHQKTAPLWKSKRYDNVQGHKTFEQFEEWREGKEQRVQAEREKKAKEEALAGTVLYEGQHTHGIPVINPKSSRLMAARERQPRSQVYQALYQDASTRRKKQADSKVAAQFEAERMMREEIGKDGAPTGVELPAARKVDVETVVGRLHDGGVIDDIAQREALLASGAYETSQHHHRTSPRGNFFSTSRASPFRRQEAWTPLTPGRSAYVEARYDNV